MKRCLGLLIPLVLMGCDAAQIDSCTPSSSVFCGIARPEDIEIVPGTRWLLVSELGRSQGPGQLVLLDPATDERRILTTEPPPVAEGVAFPQCGAAPTTLRPRGFHLSSGPESSFRLFVIAGTRVERYRLTATDAEASLTWEGCVEVPATLTANDVAALPGEGFVISHMYDPPRDVWLNAKMVLGLNTGYAAKWLPDTGWTKIPNTGVSFANGIQVDPATSRIYLSSMFTQRIVSVMPDGAEKWESTRAPIQTDNLSWSDDGRLIGAGHTGFPVYGISACRDIGEAPCSFPFAVVAFDPKTLAQTTLYQLPTGNTPGASVAVLRNNELFLGTAFGDRISRVPLKQ
jgi:sugar lactone lactonase YvrE